MNAQVVLAVHRMPVADLYFDYDGAVRSGAGTIPKWEGTLRTKLLAEVARRTNSFELWKKVLRMAGRYHRKLLSEALDNLHTLAKTFDEWLWIANRRFQDSWEVAREQAVARAKTFDDRIALIGSHCLEMRECRQLVAAVTTSATTLEERLAIIEACASGFGEEQGKELFRTIENEAMASQPPTATHLTRLLKIAEKHRDRDSWTADGGYDHYRDDFFAAAVVRLAAAIQKTAPTAEPPE
jgi:hypothetical protein